METRLIFGSRGYPHITILSIQPQQAPAKELMYTEFYTLYWWAVTLCVRVRYPREKTLPVSLHYLAVTQIRADAVRYASFRYVIGVPVWSRPCSAPATFDA